MYQKKQTIYQMSPVPLRVNVIVLHVNCLIKVNIKALTALVGWLSRSVSWENGPERGLKTAVSFNS